MRIIKNGFIPFGRFYGLNILGFLFVKKDAELTDKHLTHEAIHTAQQYEILTASALLALVLSNLFASWWYLLVAVVMPIALYVLAWLVEVVLPPYGSAYKDSPFEREAYANEADTIYLATRKPFAWVKHFVKTRK